MTLFLAAHISTSFAQTASSEQELTLVFLYNFLKFTEWPNPAASNEMVFCVTSNATFGPELEAISGRTAQNKPVRVKHLDLGENITDCHLLYLPQEEKSMRIRAWLKNTENLPILLVSNIGDFLDMGGMITLVDADNRLQFEVDLDHVKRVGLKLNSQLLKIAREVRGK
jgi:hypothetical protein